MKNFATLIRNRRSTRHFTDQALTPEQAESLLKAALMAPSSRGRAPWYFVAVDDRERLRGLAQCKPHGADFLAECSLAVAVLANPMESDVWEEDAAIAAIYMQLQAEDLGLGSCWCQICNRETADGGSAADYVRQLLDIPYQLEVVAIIGFGHKAQTQPPIDESNLAWEKIFINRCTLMDSPTDEGKEPHA